MDISAIMVYVDTSQHAPVRLSHAVALAGAFQATLIGLLSGLPEDAASTNSPPTNRDATRQVFESATEGTTIAVDWRIGEGSAVDAIHCEGRLADLIVVSQPEPDSGNAAAARRFVEAAIVSTGPPVLVIPPGPAVSWRAWPYASAIVAWNGTRESARALRDALPVLKRARHVDIVCCMPSVACREQGIAPVSYAMTWLSRRGIKATLIQLVLKPSADIGEALLELAARRCADLLVCGAHRHGAREECLPGGVAGTVLSRSPIPALFAC